MSDNSKVIATEKGQLVKPTCWRDLPAPTMTREEIEQQYFANSRLFLPAVLRIPLASTLSFLSGFTLGAAHGGKMSGLQFRAEHAHKLPATTTGWYLYHKSKNYYAAKGAVRNGIRTGMRVSLWTTSMFAIEQMFDSYRGTADLLNTVTSFVTVGGWFSLWNRFSLPATARTAKFALIGGLIYGGLQDILGALRGRRIGYVEWVKDRLGKQSAEHPKGQ